MPEGRGFRGVNLVMHIRVLKEISGNQAPWEVVFYTGRRCKLTVHSDKNGPFAYELTHEDAVFAPAVNITPTADGSVLILLSFRDILAELQDSERVRQAVTDIRNFCEDCEADGILRIHRT